MASAVGAAGVSASTSQQGNAIPITNLYLGGADYPTLDSFSVSAACRMPLYEELAHHLTQVYKSNKDASD